MALAGLWRMHHETPIERVFLAGDLLIHDRLLQAHVAERGGHDQVAGGIEPGFEPGAVPRRAGFFEAESIALGSAPGCTRKSYSNCCGLP